MLGVIPALGNEAPFGGAAAARDRGRGTRADGPQPRTPLARLPSRHPRRGVPRAALEPARRHRRPGQPDRRRHQRPGRRGQDLDERDAGPLARAGRAAGRARRPRPAPPRRPPPPRRRQRARAAPTCCTTAARSRSACSSSRRRRARRRPAASTSCPPAHASANPTELLGTPRTGRLLDALAKEADIVLLDTPPVLPVADTLVIGRLAAGAVLVVESRRTPVQMVNRAKAALIRNQTRILGRGAQPAPPRRRRRRLRVRLRRARPEVAWTDPSRLGARTPTFWRDRPVAVTGATGFLGSHLTAQLVDVGAARRRARPRRRAAVADRRRRGPTRWPSCAARSRTRPSSSGCSATTRSRTVLHLAAQSQVGVANRNPLATYEANVAGTWSVLEAVRRSPARRAGRHRQQRQGLRRPAAAPLRRGHAAPRRQPVRRVEGLRRPHLHELPPHLRRAGVRHPVRQLLRPRRPQLGAARARHDPVAAAGRAAGDPLRRHDGARLPLRRRRRASPTSGSSRRWPRTRRWSARPSTSPPRPRSPCSSSSPRSRQAAGTDLEPRHPRHRHPRDRQPVPLRGQGPQGAGLGAHGVRGGGARRDRRPGTATQLGARGQVTRRGPRRAGRHRRGRVTSGAGWSPTWRGGGTAVRALVAPARAVAGHGGPARRRPARPRGADRRGARGRAAPSCTWPGHNEVVAAADPDRALAETALVGRHVIEAAAAAGVGRVVYVSTIHVYGDRLAPGATVDEDGRRRRRTAPTPSPAWPSSTCVADGPDPVVLRLSNAVGAPAHPDVDRWTLVAADLCRSAVTTGELRAALDRPAVARLHRAGRRRPGASAPPPTPPASPPAPTTSRRAARPPSGPWPSWSRTASRRARAGGRRSRRPTRSDPDPAPYHLDPGRLAAHGVARRSAAGRLDR